MLYFIAGLVIGLMFACMFSGDSLGGINMTDNERRRIIGLIRRAATERDMAVVLWKDGVHIDMVPFPEREF